MFEKSSKVQSPLNLTTTETTWKKSGDSVDLDSAVLIDNFFINRDGKSDCYKLVNLLKKRVTKPIKMKDRNKICTSNSDFNDFFASVYCKPSLQEDSVFPLKYLTIGLVFVKDSWSRDKPGAGSASIPGDALSQPTSSFSPPERCLFNCFLETAEYPKQWKTYTITPLPKGDSKTV